MATNPNNAVGTNGAFGGRTSVNAFNDVLSVFNGRGIIQGWDMAPNSGMIINIGGNGSTRDVAVAQDNIGNKTTINNISEEPIALTIPAAPAASSRIDAVVAYVDNPAQGSATETDNPAACGLIVVEGTVATTPTAPDEEAIRTAITADGGAGTVAYYVVLGTVTVASGTTDISANMLTKGGYAAVTSNNVDCTYYAGDSISIGSATTAASGESLLFVTGGYITSGQTSIAFNIPLPKSAIGTNPRFTSGLIWARTVSGNNAINGVNITLFSTTITPLNNHSLGVQVRNGNGAQFPNTTNNTPLAIAGYFTISFE